MARRRSNNPFGFVFKAKRRSKRRRPRRRRAGSGQTEDQDVDISDTLSPQATKLKIKKILPFLETLQDVKCGQNRSILLSHLNDEACQTLYQTIANILASDRLHPTVKEKLKNLLRDHKDSFLNIVDEEKSSALKKKELMKIGGFPLSAVLAAAVPLMLDLIKPKYQK